MLVATAIFKDEKGRELCRQTWRGHEVQTHNGVKPVEDLAAGDKVRMPWGDVAVVSEIIRRREG